MILRPRLVIPWTNSSPTDFQFSASSDEGPTSLSGITTGDGTYVSLLVVLEGTGVSLLVEFEGTDVSLLVEVEVPTSVSESATPAFTDSALKVCSPSSGPDANILSSCNSS